MNFIPTGIEPCSGCGDAIQLKPGAIFVYVFVAREILVVGKTAADHTWLPLQEKPHLFCEKCACAGRALLTSPEEIKALTGKN
jgi:hypothetical protein